MSNRRGSTLDSENQNDLNDDWCCPQCGAGVAWKEEVESYLCFLCGILFPREARVFCEEET